MRKPQLWKCLHTDRPYRALGLCNACYLRQNGGSQKYYSKHRAKMIRNAVNWNKDNPIKRRDTSRRHFNATYSKNRIVWVLRARLGIALRGYHKSASTLTLLGCSLPDFKKYIEAQFLPGMSWENHSKSGWHIDHKKPCASFNLSEIQQQKECFHYSNLQPLWAFDNLSKGCRA